MNIFQVLSQGKSRLHEPSMSAMLGYLLDSNKDHGLGDSVIRKLLQTIDDERFREIASSGFIDSQVSLEEPYQLIRHSSLTTEPSTQKTMRTGEDIGEILEETDIKTKSGEYRVVRRDSTQTQVFSIETGDKEVARHILAEYIDENNIEIQHEKYNTRTIGKKFFEWRKQNLTKSSSGRAKGVRR